MPPFPERTSLNTKFSLPASIERLFASTDGIQVGVLLTRSFAGTSDATPEGTFDWILGPQLHGRWGDPRRSQILSYLFRTSVQSVETNGGFTIGIRRGDGQLAAAAVVCMWQRYPPPGHKEYLKVPELPGVFESFSMKQCQHGHLLAPFSTPLNNYCCNLCGCTKATGSSMMSCRGCDYDVCSVCCQVSMDAGRCVRDSLMLGINGRLEVLSKVQDAAHERHMPGPHLHVNFIGVDPDCQRRGLCGKLMRNIVAIAAASGLPIYLETHGRRNANMYARFGFRIVEEFTVAWPHDPEGAGILPANFALVLPAADITGDCSPTRR